MASVLHLLKRNQQLPTKSSESPFSGLEDIQVHCFLMRTGKKAVPRGWGPHSASRSYPTSHTPAQATPRPSAHPSVPPGAQGPQPVGRAASQQSHGNLLEKAGWL